jgi:D-glycero-alpha-D-manno-heptose-7-phosphate kinase
VEIHHQGDLPAGSGVGSSSSFTVGLINALNFLLGNNLSKNELALGAIQMEQNVLNENVGSQDQVAVAYGGFNLIKFSKEGKIEVNPLRISNSRLNELNRNLCFLYLGDDRRAGEIAGDVIQNLNKRENQLFQMNSLVKKASQLLEGEGNLDEFGYLLDETWFLKKSLSPLISTDEINNV